MNELVLLNNLLNSLEFENIKNYRDTIDNITLLLYFLEMDGVNVEAYKDRFHKIRSIKNL